jgi:hypothetical protein
MKAFYCILGIRDMDVFLNNRHPEDYIKIHIFLSPGAPNIEGRENGG